MGTPSELVDVEALAAELNLTRFRIAQLVKREGMPRAARGKYDLRACVRWYIRFLQDALERRGPRGGVASVEDQIREEKLRQARMESERLRLELAERSGRVVSVEVVGREWDAAVSRGRARALEAVGAEAGHLIGLASIQEAHEAGVRIVYAILAAMANAEGSGHDGRARGRARNRRTGRARADRAGVPPGGAAAAPPG